MAKKKSLFAGEKGPAEFSYRLYVELIDNNCNFSLY